MADVKKPHPLALGGKRPEPTRKGRPKKDGPRYPSGQLKPPKPNARVIADRAAICSDPTMASCPLDASFARGWISETEHAAGRAFIAVHMKAGFQGPGYSSSQAYLPSLPAGSADELSANWREMSTGQVLAIKWSTLSPKEIAAIWDSALRDLGRSADPTKADAFAAEANRKWRSIHASLTTMQRLRVDEFCIRETWPRWFFDRVNGNMRGHYEDERSILIEGLRVIARTLEKPKTPAIRDIVEEPAPQADVSQAPARVERQVYVDERGPWLEVERISRRPRS